MFVVSELVVDHVVVAVAYGVVAHNVAGVVDHHDEVVAGFVLVVVHHDVAVVVAHVA